MTAVHAAFPATLKIVFARNCETAIVDNFFELPAELPQRPAAIDHGEPQAVGVIAHFFRQTVTEVIAQEDNEPGVLGKGFPQIAGFSASPVFHPRYTFTCKDLLDLFDIIPSDYYGCHKKPSLLLIPWDESPHLFIILKPQLFALRRRDAKKNRSSGDIRYTPIR
jgi:hypothetical protein